MLYRTPVSVSVSVSVSPSLEAMPSPSRSFISCGSRCSDSRGATAVPNGVQGSVKPPHSARPSTRSFENASSARQRVLQGRRNSLSDIPTSKIAVGVEPGKRAGFKRAYSSVSADTGCGGASPAARQSDATALTAAAVADARARWIAANGGKSLMTTTQQATGRAGGTHGTGTSHVQAADDTAGGSRVKRADVAGEVCALAARGGGSLAQRPDGAGSGGGVSDGGCVQALERRLSRVTIAALRGERDKKRYACDKIPVNSVKEHSENQRRPADVSVPQGEIQRRQAGGDVEASRRRYVPPGVVPAGSDIDCTRCRRCRIFTARRYQPHHRRQSV